MSKKLIYIIIILALFFPSAFAQNQHDAAPSSCDISKYEIIGDENIKKGQSVEYVVRSSDGSGSEVRANVFKIIQANNLLYKVKNEKIAHIFDNIGSYKLQAEFYNEIGCLFKLDKQINVYNKISVYMGKSMDEFALNFDQNFQKHSTYLKKIDISDDKTLSEETLLDILSANIYYLKNTENIIVNQSQFDLLLQSFGKINKIADLNLGQKNIYVVTDLNKNFLKRILAKYLKILDIDKMYSLSQENFLNFLSALSFDKEGKTLPYVQGFSISFAESPKYYVVSYLVDTLIYNGFPLDLIGMFFLLCVSALVVSIFRQVIGFSVFGIYSPILFAVCMLVLGVPLSLILLLIGFISKLLVKLFSKKIYLLFNAKITFLICLYFLLIIVGFGLVRIMGINIVDITMFSNGFVIFALFFVIIVTDKVFNDGFKLFSIGWRVGFAEFLLISFAVYGLLYRSRLKYLLLSFPEIIVLVLILNIIVGRFTGLQLLEYLRFMPLIKKSFDGEEE